MAVSRNPPAFRAFVIAAWISAVGVNGGRPIRFAGVFGSAGTRTGLP